MGYNLTYQPLTKYPAPLSRDCVWAMKYGSGPLVPALNHYRIKDDRSPGSIPKEPGVSMTLETWVHDPCIYNDPILKGSWRLQEDSALESARIVWRSVAGEGLRAQRNPVALPVRGIQLGFSCLKKKITKYSTMGWQLGLDIQQISWTQWMPFILQLQVLG